MDESNGSHCYEQQIFPFCVRFREDRQYRRKLLHTVCTTCSMVSAGVCQTLIGLALPDLMILIKQDLAEASWIFTTWSFGNMLGSLLAGYAYDRLNKLIVLVSLSLGLATTTGSTPWCTSFPVMLMIHLVGGGFVSGIHLAVTADTIHLWKKQKTTILQIVHLAATAGGILSPFLVNPFLTKRNREGNIPFNATFDETLNNRNSSNMVLKMENSSSLMTQKIEAPQISETNIQYAYFLASGVALIGALSYLTVCVTSGNVYSEEAKERNINSATGDSNNKHKKAVLRKIISLFVCVVSVQTMLYAMQRHEFGLFMTYVIQKLNWSKNKTSNVMAVFWCAFCAGRIVAVIALRIFKEDYLNWCYIFITSVGIIGLCVSFYLRLSTSVVVCLLISAFGMAPLFTFMLSWFSSHITQVTGRITGAVYVFMAIGGMVVPVLSGYLMNNVSYDWFLYILFILLLLMIFVTFILRLLHRKLVSASK